jgi:hypothetical protein
LLGTNGTSQQSNLSSHGPGVRRTSTRTANRTGRMRPSQQYSGWFSEQALPLASGTSGGSSP